ncbi:MAG: ATP-binding protein [Chloroflexi bacterium]|nr:ATP-binding protein [Chloroflexota bacterium]
MPDDSDAAALRTELSRTQSILGALLGHHWPGSLYETLDAPGRYRNTIQALKTLILAESRGRPVVLEIEDAHWLDEASQELLTTLTRQVEAVPLLIVLTSRYYDDGSRRNFPWLPVHLAGTRPERFVRGRLTTPGRIHPAPSYHTHLAPFCGKKPGQSVLCPTIADLLSGKRVIDPDTPGLDGRGDGFHHSGQHQRHPHGSH